MWYSSDTCSEVSFHGFSISHRRRQTTRPPLLPQRAQADAGHVNVGLLPKRTTRRRRRLRPASKPPAQTAVVRLALRPWRLRCPLNLPVAGLGADAEAMAAATSSSRPQRHALSPRHAPPGMLYASPLSAMPLQSRRKLPHRLRVLLENTRARRHDPPERTCSAPLPATSRLGR